jgi:hypothetical protein
MTDEMMALRGLMEKNAAAETFWTNFLRKLARRGLRA